MRVLNGDVEQLIGWRILFLNLRRKLSGVSKGINLAHQLSMRLVSFLYDFDPIPTLPTGRTLAGLPLRHFQHPNVHSPKAFRD